MPNDPYCFFTHFILFSFFLNLNILILIIIIFPIFPIIFFTANQGVRSNMLGSLPRMQSLNPFYNERFEGPNSYDLRLFHYAFHSVVQNAIQVGLNILMGAASPTLSFLSSLLRLFPSTARLSSDYLLLTTITAPVTIDNPDYYYYFLFPSSDFGPLHHHHHHLLLLLLLLTSFSDLPPDRPPVRPLKQSTLCRRLPENRS